MANEEFFNFEEALDKLRLKEEELKRLVSEGEIRAFRDGDTMQLRRSDVEHLRQELMGGDVVDLGDDELVFEDDVELDDPGMATEEIADMATLLDDDVEDVGELDLEAEPDEPSPVVAAAATAGAASAVRRSSAAAGEEPASEGMGIRFALIVTAVVQVMAMPVVVSVAKGSASSLARTIAGLFGHDL